MGLKTVFKYRRSSSKHKRKGNTVMKRIAALLLTIIIGFGLMAFGEEDSLIGVWKINKYVNNSQILPGSSISSGSSLFEFTSEGTILHHGSGTWHYDSTEDMILISPYSLFSLLDFILPSDREPVQYDYRIYEGRLIIKGYLASNRWQLFDKITGTEGLVGIWKFAGFFDEEELPAFLNDPESYESTETSFGDALSYTLEFTATGKMVDTKTYELIRYKAVDGNTIMLINENGEPTDIVLNFHFEKGQLVLSMIDEPDNGEKSTVQLFLKRVE